jgi:mannose-6-phosphate isomerase-like protein (cupin superfamily)
VILGIGMTEGLASSKNWTCATLSERVVRYGDLIPCYNAFIDCRTPGSEAKENFTIIGPGVSENPNQHVHITEPHGFNIGGARQPPGCVNSQHSHDTAEVFVVHSGHWRFDLGENGDDAQVELHPGDVISIPTHVFRGFTATAFADDGSPGFLWAVLGQDNPGRVTWAPQVFDMAKDYGLTLLDNGSLIDTAAGQVIPTDAHIMAKTTAEQVAGIRVPTAQEAEGFAWRSTSKHAQIIGSGGPIEWDHGFELSRLLLRGGQALDACTTGQQRVLFVHHGTLSVSVADGILDLEAGDTVTLPAYLEHRLFSTPGCTVYEVCR